MALKPVRLIYQSRNFVTGLTNVKAQIYIDGVAKAVGANALALAEIDATNAPGVYELVVSAATLTGYGATAGQNLEAVINSASASAEAIFRTILTAIYSDDLDSHLTSQDTAIAAVKGDTVAIRADLETSTSSLPNIFSAINQIKSNTGFAAPIPSTLIKPGSGSNPYRIPFRIYDDASNLIDADSQLVKVTVTNQAGADRSNFLTGYTAGTPGYANMIRDSLGKYHVDMSIPSTAAQEELIFNFDYTVNSGTARSQISTTEIISDVQADGFALQSTLTATQATVNANYQVLTDATVGLAAANTLQVAIKGQTDKIGDSTIGLAAIKSAINALQTDVTSNVEGTGFNVATDSLHAIAQSIALLSYSGGKAV